MNQKKNPQKTSSGIQKNNQNSHSNSVEEIIKLLEKDDLSESDLKKIAVIVSQETRTTTISGPIPDPITFGLYEKIIPGSAKDILDEFKEQSKHRRSIENIVVTSREKQSSKGQIMAFILGLFSLIGTVYLATIGERLIASILGSTLLSLTGSYFYGVFKTNQSLKEKKIPIKKQVDEKDS